MRNSRLSWWVPGLAAGLLTLLALVGPGPVVAQPAVTVSPPPGTYASTQAFDLVVIVDLAGLGITGGLVTFDGNDVTGPFVGCARVGGLPSGALTFRCTGLTAAALGPGTHLFEVILFLSDGSAIQSGAMWLVLSAG